MCVGESACVCVYRRMQVCVRKVEGMLCTGRKRMVCVLLCEVHVCAVEVSHRCPTVNFALYFYYYGLPGMTQLTRKSPIALTLILRGSPGPTV